MITMDAREKTTEVGPTGYFPSRQIDHYKILRILGHGGMGRVYLALDLFEQRQVVLKFLNDDIGGDIATFERFRREKAIGSRLKHPHIQQALNKDEKRSDQYLVTEYIEGQTLRAVLEAREGQPLPVEEALRLADQICDALCYCHEHGVYHRDIKPENILIQADGQVKLIDFGIARLAGARRVTWCGLSGIVGTPDYLAPEQVRGERGGAGSDIYAVGMLLYEMLCGRTPFDGENAFAVMNQSVSQDPPSIWTYNPYLCPRLVTVVMRAVRRDKEKRYQTISNLLNDLRHLNEVDPLPYQPDAPRVNYGGRVAITVALSVLVILLVILAFAFLLPYVI